MKNERGSGFKIQKDTLMMYTKHQFSFQSHLIQNSGRFSRIAVAFLLVALFSASAFSQPLAQGKSKFLGVGTGSNIWSGLHLYWNQITPGNDGKWGSVEGTQGQFNWTNLDNIYNYTINRSFRYKHHTLVWGQQQPSWIGSLDSAAQRAAVVNWIQNVGQRYGSMAMVDVVNEPFHAVPVYANALGGAGVSGYDWVITSFRLARQYCFPGVKLILNEYNVLHSNTVTTNYIRLI
ncbi:MAG: endo-1,4-beta-xylanase, partial [Ignavibacteriae bacterium]|nr:endo-1,4-beta-xylanase [Ignavibacteriota bacterium]